MGMPFVPVKDMVGTDLMNIKSFMGDGKYKMIESPLTAARDAGAGAASDVAIIHVQQADEEGNAQMWGIGGDCKWGANAAVSHRELRTDRQPGNDRQGSVPHHRAGVQGCRGDRGALRRASRIHARLL